MTYPSFSVGEVLTAADMNAVGLWLVKTQTVGTGITTTVDVTGAFSADFDDYLIRYSGTCTATGVCLGMRMGLVAQSGYYGQLIYGSYASLSGGFVNDNNLQQWTHCSGGTGGRTNFWATVMSPYLSSDTTMTSTYHDGANSGHKTGWLNNDNSYTSFQLIVANGSISGGTIRVYGYRN